MTTNAPDWQLILRLALVANLAYAHSTVNDPRTGTQALVSQFGSDIIVAFRGSSEPKDFILDARFLKSELVWSRNDSVAEVHAGFLAAFEAVDVEVVKQVRNLLAQKPAARVYVTGHSLGGALAQLCALELVRQKFPLALVATFGSPRVGNKTFATIYNQATVAANVSSLQTTLRDLTLNVVNEGDPVPLLPPLLNGYRDAGTELFIRKDGSVQVDPFIGFEIFTDVMGAVSSWRNYRLGLLPNHFIATYQERISHLA